MSVPAKCPRCLGKLRPPNLWTSSWQCEAHGSVHPYYVAKTPGEAALDRVVELARVPVWVPHPLPVGWFVSGIAWAGDERSGARAVAIACTGPNPLEGCADLILVAEEPATGVLTRFAGLPGPDPGVLEGRPEAKVEARLGNRLHPTALWPLAGAPSDRAAFAGEAGAVWLALVFWPDAASLLLAEQLTIADARDGLPGELIYGAACPRLAEPLPAGGASR